MNDKKKIKKHIDLPIEDEDRQLFLNAIENLNVEQALRQKRNLDNEHSSNENKKKPNKIESIDLHGMTVSDAERAVESFLREKIRQLISPIKIRIITGKGLHSRHGGPLLSSEIHQYVKLKFAKNIQQIDESPSEVKIGGVPIRGHFDVTLKKS